jgi:hypothetical protein
MNGLNEMGEHMMNTVLTESILRGRKVMNKNREFIDKEGNVKKVISPKTKVTDSVVIADIESLLK